MTIFDYHIFSRETRVFLFMEWKKQSLFDLINQKLFWIEEKGKTTYADGTKM